ncbi:MAG TPA: TetR/AcrR family transcriptional regulator [Chthoniobacter sp.]|jgi:TetR/AcrR family transcriptional repressor of nem operon
MPRTSDADERLLNAALELIWKNSYHATSVDDICRAAEVRKGSFYHFFPSKSQLALAALEAAWRRRKSILDELFSPTLPPLRRITGYFDHVAKTQRAHRGKCGCVLGCPFFNVGCEVGTQGSALGTKIRKILDRQLLYFETAIRDAHAQRTVRAPDARVAARMLFAFYQGTLAQARIRNDPRLLGELRTGALQLLGARGEARAR